LGLWRTFNFRLFLLSRGTRVCALFDDRFEGRALGLHANVAVMLEHLLGDVTGDIHDRLIAGAALGKIGNQRVPVVVPAALHPGIFAHVIPCRLERGNRTRWIARTRLPEGEDVPLRLGLSELLAIPLPIFGEDFQEG
jgi:hypothetical protein